MDIDKIIADWHQDHFGNITPGTELAHQHDNALKDLKRRLTPKTETPNTKEPE